MENEEPQGARGFQHQLDQLAEQVAANKAVIAELRDHAEAAGIRADETDVRAMEQGLRLDDLAHRNDLDHAIIATLEADGVVRREQVENLTQALKSSRTIGAAIGIIMANRGLTEAEAFRALVTFSQHTNRKVRDLAQDIVSTGDVAGLPTPAAADSAAASAPRGTP